ncbi:MAG: DUF1294 domain-containing protein [Lachnospiraceae bacterium]|nr:DUF1294 domain-containing protein [Lachnospiraceae bacterium]MDE7205112.1 DUF1294 domain-containing protein [Lachnospiraceae bacterium]
MNILNIIALYLILMNITGFAMMGIDKRKAIKHLWRVRESTLFLIALTGGSVGSILGMRIFHHKTRHWYFVYGMPLILILQILLIVLIIKRG